MNEKMTVSQSANGIDSSWPPTGPAVDHSWALDPIQLRRSFWADPQAVKSLEEVMQSLVSAYLDANLNSRGIPMKEFMDSFEKQVLLSCLRLTQGHQRNAAGILGIKCTALFEKMRKHCINGRQLKLVPKLSGNRFRAAE
jgi:DNA-binding NtrC family response regulator